MAVEPVEALQCPLFAPPLEDEIAGRPQGAAQMVKPAEASRETLDTSNAWTPQSLVAAKGGRRIAGPGLDAGGKGDGVLDGESGALRQIRQHGMRGIAEKGDAAFAEAAQTGEAVAPVKPKAAAGLMRGRSVDHRPSAPIRLAPLASLPSTARATTSPPCASTAVSSKPGLRTAGARLCATARSPAWRSARCKVR